MLVLSLTLPHPVTDRRTMVVETDTRSIIDDPGEWPYNSASSTHRKAFGNVAATEGVSLLWVNRYGFRAEIGGAFDPIETVRAIYDGLGADKDSPMRLRWEMWHDATVGSPRSAWLTQLVRYGSPEIDHILDNFTLGEEAIQDS